MSVKKYIADKLTEKFEGVDEEVISRVSVAAAKNCKTEEDADAWIEKQTVHTLYKSYTDSRVTDAANKSVKTYEAKYGLKDGKKVKKEPEDDDDDDDDDEGKGKKKDDMPAWAKSMFERLDALQQDKTKNTRRNSLTEALKDVKEENKANFLKAYERMSFKDDDDFNDWLENDVKSFAEEAIKKQKVDESHVSAPKAGRTDNTKEINPILKARIEANEKQAPQTSVLRGLGTQTTD